MRKVGLSPEELKRLYLDEHLTLQQIADRFGVSIQAIFYHLDRLQVPRRHPPVYEIDIDALKAAYAEGKTTAAIATEFGLPRTIVLRRLRKAGVVLDHTRGVRGVPHPERSGAGHPRWKGGRVVRPEGYAFLKMPGHHLANPNGYVTEHRLVWEQTHGRRLSPGEDVHHINGIRSDNRPENLVALMRSDHMRHHAHERWHPTPE